MASSFRSEFAMESNVLMRRAAWCGVVFALAIILTFLNFMPPVSVKYHVRSKMVVSESRLEKLRELAVADRLAVKQEVSKEVLLMSVKVLDLAEQAYSAGTEPTNEKVVLVEVGTLWDSRCTAERHFRWMNTMSKIAPDKLARNNAAQAVRFARWELEAAQHYQSQFAFQAAKEQLPAESPVVSATEQSSAAATVSSAADAGKPRTFQLATYTEASSSGLSLPTASLPTPPSSSPPDSDRSDPNSSGSTSNAVVKVQAQLASPLETQDDRKLELQLKAHVNSAKERVQQAEMAWLQEIERSSGTLQIASVPVIAPRSTSIPFWMAASILVLGLAAASTAGWCQHRGHSGGAFQASQVAEQLALHSVPTAGRLVLFRSDHETTISSTGALTVARVGHYLSRAGEWGLTFWVFIAVSRFFLDAIWRDVLISSPLAAFGRLLAGMP